MVYVIVILVLAMVVGPVLWMRPSAGQARQAQLRMRARELGLDIRIAELPQTHRARVRREDTFQGVVYRLPVFDPRTVVALSHRVVRDAAEAAWEVEGDPLPARLQASFERVCALLPADVVAVELGPQGPAVYWRERGGDEAVAAIAAQLRELRGAMAS
ncbi:MAG: hypothetical protein ABW049_05805 [Spongiibacteraceae bacterium]